jgi:CheY-like chemotaxis protein
VEKRKEQNLSLFREYVNEKEYYTKKNILVVDDDPDYLAHIKEQLEEFYRVTCVRSGADAYKSLIREIPDLILLDYLMPDENGPAVLRRIQASSDWCDIPVIFLTGVSEKSAVLQTLTELRPQGYVVKPCKRSELVAKIIDVLE